MIATDWNEFKELSEIHLQDKQFAMVNVAKFGSKALDLLCGPETYGDSYPSMVKEACKADINNGVENCRTTSINASHLNLLGIDSKQMFIKPSELMEKNDRIVNAIELSKKLSVKLEPKPKLSRSIKI